MPQSRTQTPLRITPTPFRPTLLSIPPSPFSPLTPLTPKPHPASRPLSRAHSSQPQHTHAAAAPSTPLAWTWQCHQCARTYALGATRRCLDDGHAFCAGTTALRGVRGDRPARRVKRHRACKSEFDYTGWKDWGRWRRRGGAARSGGEGGRSWKGKGSGKDCWNACDYPSECRWGRRFGVHTPLESEFPVLEVCSERIERGATPEYVGEGVLRGENVGGEKEEEGGGKSDLWGLLASAKRRRSGKGSPLAGGEEGKDERDGDGDVVMGNIDPALLALSSPAAPPASTPTVGSGAIDMLRVLMKRKGSRRGRTNASGLNRGDEYPVPLLTVPKPVLTKERDDVGMGDPEAMLEEFAPLERVRSRGVGV